MKNAITLPSILILTISISVFFYYFLIPENKVETNKLYFDAVKLYEKKQYVTAYKKLIEISQFNKFAYFYLGVINEKYFKQPNLSAQNYLKLVNIDIDKYLQDIPNASIKKYYKAIFYQAKNNLANLYWKGSGIKQNKNLAIKLFKEAADNGILESQITLGKIFMERQDFNNAEKYFLKAGNTNPSSAYFNLYLLYSQNKEKFNEEKAMKFLEKSALLGNLIAKNNLAYILASRYEKYNRAEKLINEALNCKPNDINFLGTLGFILIQQGKDEKIKKTYSKIFLIDPLNIEFRYDYYKYLMRKQDTIEAQNQISKIKIAGKYKILKNLCLTNEERKILKFLENK